MRRSIPLSLSLIALVLLIGIPLSGAQETEHAFVGSKKCKKCHIKEYKSWEETTMAKAFDILKPGERAEAKAAADLDPDKDYTTDATCLPCHTTGYGKEGGFVDIETTPELAGVGCETCHGAGATYIQDQLMSLKNKEYDLKEVVAAGMVEKVSEKQCTPCHNAESPFVGDDFVFDYEAVKDEGTHEKFPMKYDHSGKAAE